MEHDDVQDEAVDGFGEDFDDFEAGAVDDDFGDFDDGFQEPQIPDEQDVVVEEPEALQQSPAVLSSLSPFVSRLTAELIIFDSIPKNLMTRLHG